MDTSEHDWLEGRGKECVLVAMIDDATSLVLLGFLGSDTTETSMLTLRALAYRDGALPGLPFMPAPHMSPTRPIMAWGMSAR